MVGSCFTAVRLNEFADLTFEEFSSVWLMDPQHCSATYSSKDLQSNSKAELPDSIDWRDKGAVTPVKNQVHKKSHKGLQKNKLILLCSVT